mmetsp:Transcript_16846/g.40083  ORF Transcript_16846/g.40083 Transcript_16846/m.40083 type:complete len:215 (-) Transcript_16846:692-1336(-)
MFAKGNFSWLYLGCATAATSCRPQASSLVRSNAAANSVRLRPVLRLLPVYAERDFHQVARPVWSLFWRTGPGCVPGMSALGARLVQPSVRRCFCLASKSVEPRSHAKLWRPVSRHCALFIAGARLALRAHVACPGHPHSTYLHLVWIGHRCTTRRVTGVGAGTLSGDIGWRLVTMHESLALTSPRTAQPCCSLKRKLLSAVAGRRADGGALLAR